MYKPACEDITQDEINLLPLKQFDGHIVLIDTIDKLRHNIGIINNCKLLGFDTETKPSFVKGQSNNVCLIQLANRERSFLIRLNRMGLQPEIVHLLQNPHIIKVGVALKDDLQALRKLGHFKPAGFIDLQSYVEKFGVGEKSLKKLTARVLGFRISKSQQTSNWEAEHFSEAQLSYAATDAWTCYEIYQRLLAIG
jgi:ribonuclease D